MLKHRYFSMNFFFFDRCGIQARLEALAKKGWLLESADYLGWRFTRSQPKTVHYAITYFARQNQYTSEYDENIMDFNAMCAERGWNFVTSHSNMRIYCNESPEPIPMDTDPVVELATIHRAAKRSFLPAHWTYLILCSLLLALLAWLFVSDPIQMLSDNRSLLSYLIFVPVIMVSAIELISYYRWRRRAVKHAQATGEFLPARSRPALLRVLLVFALLSYIVNLILGGFNRENVDALFRFAMIMIAGIVAYIVREHFKEKGASAEENRGATAAIVIIAVIVMQIVSSVITDQNSFENFFPKPVPEKYGIGFNFDDPLPLELEDLGLDKYSDEGYFETRSSVFLSYTEYYPTPLWHGNQGMYYIVLDVRADFLYDFLYTEFFGESTVLEELDPEIWNVDSAWQVQQSYGNNSVYHLCIDNRMIILIFEPAVDLTDAQKSLIGEKLAPVN